MSGGWPRRLDRRPRVCVDTTNDVSQDRIAVENDAVMRGRCSTVTVPHACEGSTIDADVRRAGDKQVAGDPRATVEDNVTRLDELHGAADVAVQRKTVTDDRCRKDFERGIRASLEIGIVDRRDHLVFA